MREFNWRILVGVLLLVMGALALLQAIGILPDNGSLIGIIFGVLFAGGGAVFLYVLSRDSRNNWWAAIPGMVLLFLGLLVLFSSLNIAFMNEWGGPFFLFGISLAFWVVYFMRREFWWAIIPGGVMLTLAAVAGLGTIGIDGVETGGVFFLGLAATFAVVALLPRERLTWAWIPAIILAIMGGLMTLSSTNLMSYALPVVLIGIGGYLMYKAFVKK